MVDITDAASATTSPPRSDYVFEREPTRADFQHAEEAGEAEVEHDAETGEVYQAQEAPPRADEPPPVDNKAEASNPWYPDAVGQEAATAAIVELIKTKATTDADLDAIVEANAERVKKFTQANRATINNALDDRRDDLKGGGA